jgi:hypothetical protein
VSAVSAVSVSSVDPSLYTLGKVLAGLARNKGDKGDRGDRGGVNKGDKGDNRGFAYSEEEVPYNDSVLTQLLLSRLANAVPNAKLLLLGTSMTSSPLYASPLYTLIDTINTPLIPLIIAVPHAKCKTAVASLRARGRLFRN